MVGLDLLSPLETISGGAGGNLLLYPVFCAKCVRCLVTQQPALMDETSATSARC